MEYPFVQHFHAVFYHFHSPTLQINGLAEKNGAIAPGP